MLSFAGIPVHDRLREAHTIIDAPIDTQRNGLLEIRPASEGGRIVCLANQKGGVGKTTTSVNLAAGLALRGHTVLVVDCDPQSNATTGLGLDHRNVAPSTYELVVDGVALESAVRRTAIKGLDCVPASPDLAGAEVELVGESSRESKLHHSLSAARSRYDLIFLDCPPSLGLLTVNALAAAHDLIVPVQCEYYALEGLGQLLGTAERIRTTINSQLRIAGFVLTMYDARTKLASQVADEVRSYFGPFVFDTIVPRSVRLSEAPSFGEPVLTLDPSSRGAISYRLLATEFETRHELPTHVPAPPQPTTKEPAVQLAGPPKERGYGVTTAAPGDVETAWPPQDPWGAP